jgi:hypothetical protein
MLASKRMINSVARMKNRPPDIRILTIRDHKVVLDVDLPHVYGVTTKRLNEELRPQSEPFSDGFRVSTHGGRIRIFKVANCDLERRYRPSRIVASAHASDSEVEDLMERARSDIIKERFDGVT